MVGQLLWCAAHTAYIGRGNYFYYTYDALYICVYLYKRIHLHNYTCMRCKQISSLLYTLITLLLYFHCTYTILHSRHYLHVCHVSNALPTPLIRMLER